MRRKKLKVNFFVELGWFLVEGTKTRKKTQDV